MVKVQYQQLSPEYFEQVVTLAIAVHGENYLDLSGIRQLYERSFFKDINASWVALLEGQVVGFRLTIAAPDWSADKWCSPADWGVEKKHLCYFKCNTVQQNCRGMGIGSELLIRSINNAKLQGCRAGLAHIWLASPGNSAFRYFSKCGGQLVKHHPNKWRELSIRDGYCCPVCKDLCECTAAEMILHFTY
jgi:GNAT superfamily N-acetyltransferase